MRVGFGLSGWVVLSAFVFPSLSAAQVTRESEPYEDRTLSPYFEVQGGVSGVDRLPLVETSVDVHISGVIAAVTVRQIYLNEGSRPLHAKYVFPASTRAAVNGLRMRIGARVVEAVIREKEQARKEFKRAKKEGRNAALLEQVRPNVFDMRLANVMPGDRIEVELRYTELVVPSEGVYEFVYPTVVGPRYTGGTGEWRFGQASPAAIPPGVEPWTPIVTIPRSAGSPSEFDIDVTVAGGMPLRNLAVPSHTVLMQWRGQSSVRVLLDETERNGGDRDFILRYRLADTEVASGLLLHQGENENFFLLLMEPPQRVVPELIPPREYIFVVDVSGSMGGFPLEVSKTLLLDLVLGLRESDSFNVLLFAGGSTLFAPQSVAATRENVAMAWDFIDRQKGGGGTELPRALERALALPKVTAGARTIVVATDGLISGEREAFRIVRDRLNEASVFAFGIGTSVNRHLIEGLARAGMSESFVVARPQEASRVAASFREYVSAPVLTDVSIDFGGLDVYDLTPKSIPDVLADRPVMVQGKWRGPPSGTITLRGLSGLGAYETSFALAAAGRDNDPALGHLWARTRITELSDQALSGSGEEVRQEITRLGLEYGLLTKYTSFIAVDRVIRNPEGEGHDVQHPGPLPEGVEGSPVGPTFQVASEPELWLFVPLLLVMLGRLGWRRKRAV